MFRDRNLTPLEEIWEYVRQPQHLNTPQKEFRRTGTVTFFSLSAILYGVISWRATEGEQLGIRIATAIGTSACPALTYFNSTVAFVEMRQHRILPETLEKYSTPLTPRQKQWQDFRAIVVAALSSLGLTTTALRYPQINNALLRYLWVAYIQACNTALHAFPVELILQYLLYRLIFEIPYQIFYAVPHRIYQYKTLSAQQWDEMQFDQFTFKTTQELRNLICSRIDAAFEEIVQQSLEFNSSTDQGFKKWLAFVKKTYAPVDQATTWNLFNFLNQQKDHSPSPQKTGWRKWTSYAGEALQSTAGQLAAYVAGAAVMSNSNNGYAADTPPTLHEETGLSIPWAVALSIPEIYLLGVLLTHIGGLNFKNDTGRIGGALQGKDVTPLHWKESTKFSFINFFVNVGIAWFSPSAATQTVEDRLGSAGWFKNVSWYCSEWGIRYLSFCSYGQFFERYTTKIIRMRPSHPNQKVAELYEIKENFKSYVQTMNPEAVHASLSDFIDEKKLGIPNRINDTDVQRIWGISKGQLQSKLNFRQGYQDEKTQWEESFFGRIWARMHRRPALQQRLLEPQDPAHGLQ